MKNKSNARQIPFSTSDQMKVLQRFKADEAFVFHTLCRVTAETLKIDHKEAEAIAQGMIAAGTVVPASKVGLTELQTFKLADQ